MTQDGNVFNLQQFDDISKNVGTLMDIFLETYCLFHKAKFISM